VTIALALYLSRGRSLRPLVKFPWVTALILVVYVFLFRNDLAQVFKGTNSYQFSTRAVVAHTIWAELGAVLLVALVGAALLGQSPLKTGRLMGRWGRIVPALTVSALLVMMLAIPLYALYGYNSRSLEKHLVFSLVFLAPLAGYACATAIRRMLSRA